ncbi:MAG: hypothetical protein ACUVXI_05115 [bacterium]
MIKDRTPFNTCYIRRCRNGKIEIENGWIPSIGAWHSTLNKIVPKGPRRFFRQEGDRRYWVVDREFERRIVREAMYFFGTVVLFDERGSRLDPRSVFDEQQELAIV